MNERIGAWSEEYHFGNCVIRSDTRELLRDGMAQKIERRTFDLILYLLKLDGRVASKDELLEHVWCNRYVSDSVIAQSIMKARKALGITGKEPGPIKTIHRVGYRFVGEVHKVIHPSTPMGPSGRDKAPPRILWLPTECPSAPAGISWARYGLISVATHMLHSQGVSTVPACEAIALYDAIEADDPVHVLSSRLLEQGADLGVVGSRLSGLREPYRLDWQMYLDGVRSANSVRGDSPAELALMAAQEIALLARVRAALLVPPEQDPRVWDELDQLMSLADSLNLMEKLAPLLARCVDLPQCPLRAMAEHLWLRAQHMDPATPVLAERLVQRAHLTGDAAYEGWARLCLAFLHLYARQPERAREQAMGGLAMVRHHAPHELLPKALLMVSHVHATTGQHVEAQMLLHEADQLIGKHPVGNLSCWMQLQRCELACLGMEIAAPGQPFLAALTSAQRLGFQASVAWLEVYCGLQCCASGDFDTGRLHLDAALVACEQSGATRASIYANLQLGSFFARTGDQDGLEQCLARLGDASLRDAPLGTAVWRWLRARHLLLTGHAPDALPLAEQAMGELVDMGVWWSEDSWIFMTQLALISGNRGVAQHMLGHLEERRHQHPLTPRRATILAVQGMLAYFDGDHAQALALLQQAHDLGRHTLMSRVLLWGLVWLALMNGHQPAPAQLSAAGHWGDRTPEGRYVQSMLKSRHWTAALRLPALALGTGTDNAVPMAADHDAAEPMRHAEWLPMPV